MTTFKVKKKESARDGIRRVAHERIEHASSAAARPDADPIEAVHEARKDTKKLRATLKLVRPVIGEEATTARTGAFAMRPAGSPTFATRRSGLRPSRRWSSDSQTIRRRAAGGRSAGSSPTPAPSGDLGTLRDRAAAADRERRRAPSTAGRSPSRGSTCSGPASNVPTRVARKRYREARDDPSDENLHEFRKRSKDLWYQLQLVRRGWPELMETTRRRGARALRPARRRPRPGRVRPPTSSVASTPLTGRPARASARADRAPARRAPGGGVRARASGSTRREAEALRRAASRPTGRRRAL